MKRSEAVGVIGRVLMFGPEGLTKDKQEKYKDMNLSEIILEELLDAGLLPPGINYNGDGESFDYVWEPEDET